MKDRTFKSATGRPVKVDGYLAFLPSVNAQREQAKFFEAQNRMAELGGDKGMKILEALMGLSSVKTR